MARLGKKRIIKCPCGNRFKPKNKQQKFCSATCARIYAPVQLRDVEVKANRIKIPWTIIFDPSDDGYDPGAILYDVDMILEYGEFEVGTVLTRMGKICVVVRPDEHNCRQTLVDVSAVVSQTLVRKDPKRISESLKNGNNQANPEERQSGPALQESTWFAENTRRPCR